MALTRDAYKQPGNIRVYIDFVQYAKAVGYFKRAHNNSVLEYEHTVWDFNPTKVNTYEAYNTSTWSGDHLGWIVEFINYGSASSDIRWMHFLQGLNYFGVFGHNIKSASGGKATKIGCNFHGKDHTGATVYAVNDSTASIVGDGNDIGNGYTIVELDGDWNTDDRNAYEAVKFYIQTPEIDDVHTNPWVNGDTVNIGCVSVGRFMDFPVSPDLQMTLSYDWSGITSQETLGGSTITNINYYKRPKWGQYPSWLHVDDATIEGYGSNADNWHISNYTQETLSPNGRRIWDVSFSYIDKKDMFHPDAEGSQAADYSGEDLDYLYDGTVHKDSILGTFLTFTLGGKIPFIFQPNKDTQEFAFCVIDGDISINQIAHGAYSISLTFKEVW